MKIKKAYEHQGISCYERRRKPHVGIAGKCAVLAAVIAVTVGAYGCRADGETVKEAYTVKHGDTVWSIARKYAGDEEDIRDVCQRIIDDNRLGKDADVTPGQQLVITHE